ncbi:hypothetical protein BDZ89DRAFT_1083195 [Hymenopellis radicata]|nr:hypothetical protein BDZ89DRAFT_1083195 [Hymenopellis radicata]
MKEAVNTDFPVHCRVTDTDQFLKVMFPVEDTLVDAIWKKVKVAHHPQSRWSAFPESVAKEDELYGAFVSVANAIHNAAEELCPHHPGENTARLGESTTWVDYHSKSPNSVDKDIARIRPDCLLAHSLLHDRVQTLPPGVIWWLQIVAALEMKRVVKQLIGYLRQILREQLDRRFVFGFTLGPRCMAVCLHDRSGVLLTSTPIDIHKSPKDFIRIIAAFAVLAPHKLGFDPSMKIYVQPNEVVESYRLTSETALDVFATDSYKKRWVITLNDGTQYLTVKVMSVARARVMRGRATLVWAVVRFVNGRPGTEVFVLKQSWRPETVKSEGEFYNEAKGSDCSHLGRITLCEDAVIDDMVDRTGSFIRAGLSASLPPGVNQERGTKRARAESEEPFLHVASTNDDEIERITTPREREYVSRVHTRVIMSTYGWPLKYFATLKELLSVFLNGVQGHAYLYENGLLHRDISAGNVIIAWWPSEGATTLGTRGCLIDFDRSKLGTRNPRTLLTTQLTIRSATLLDYFQSRKDSPLSVSVQADVISSADDVLGQTFSPAPENYTITTDRLGWRTVAQCFDFNTSITAPNNTNDGPKGSRTVRTPPYASAEILGHDKYGLDSNRVEYHDAIHDIESFLWILVNICLTRSGPRGARRTELTETDPGHDMLRRVVYYVFDSDEPDLIKNKRRLFAEPSAFERDIVGNFHAYFHDLKPLIRQWFSLLCLAYKHRELYEYHTLHERVIDLLKKAVVTVPSEEDHDDQFAANVFEERKKEISDLCLLSATSSTSNAAHSDSPPIATTFQTRSQQRVPPESPTPHKRAKKSVR